MSFIGRPSGRPPGPATRPALLLCLLALLAWHPASALEGAPAASEWQAFTRRYVAANGRVIDTANNGISHSEGQGYGMFFAVQFGDRAAFDRLWTWTQRNLARPTDALSAWRYDPRRDAPVGDANNATDGDIYIAWALLLADARWTVPEYRAAAARIAADILACCVTEVGDRTVLLPGISGFRDGEGVVVNLSYYAFPALRALSRIVPDRRWARLERDGLELMNEAAFGSWQLPPDWLLLRHAGGAPVPAPGWPARFSWDAVRVPLNLAWQQLDETTLTAARVFWSETGHSQRPPAWIDLRTGAMPPYPGHAGVRAVHALARIRNGESAGVPLRVVDAPDYFGAALVLQTRIAASMAPEAPALEPPEDAAPATRRARIAQMGRAALAWWRADDPEDPVPVAQGRWARPELEVEVRGMPPGSRGRIMPR